jgi:hypothetical protein
MTVYAIEGLDFLGKSTLVDNILDSLGFHHVIHFSKPEAGWAYLNFHDPNFAYQHDCFSNSMKLANSGARLIFDRWHLGEMVYAPMYRNYSGDYVLELEQKFGLNSNDDVKLILLVEDFSKSLHFKDDGLSLGSIENRVKEQELFIDAFNRSSIPNKMMVCVTDVDGHFRNPQDILKEVIGV